MPGATSGYGLPYPVGGDPLGDGAAEVQNLAEAVEDTFGVWQSYTPVVAGITLGNGTITGRYRRDGDDVFYRIEFQWGSSSSGAAGDLTFTLPVSPGASVAAPDEPIGQAVIRDSSSSPGTGTVFLWTACLEAVGGVVQIRKPDGTLADLVTEPFAFGNGDFIVISGRYEVD